MTDAELIQLIVIKTERESKRLTPGQVEFEYDNIRTAVRKHLWGSTSSGAKMKLRD